MLATSLHPRVDASSRIRFVNAKIYTGDTDPPFLGEVLVVGNRIAAVKSGSVDESPSDGEEVVDCEGCVLMPGLVEGHAHITFNDSFDFKIPPEEHTLIAMHNARKLLDAGFTSAYSAASAKLRTEVVIRDEINAGRIPGPRLLAAGVNTATSFSPPGLGVTRRAPAGPEITPSGGLGAGTTVGLHESDTFGYVADGAAAVAAAARLCLAQGVDSIKLNISGEEAAPPSALMR